METAAIACFVQAGFPECEMENDQMRIQRTAFVILFLVCGFAFVFGTTGLLDQPADSFFGAANQTSWQRAVSKVVSPIKLVLIGPLMPAIEFLHRDPDTPPPFFLALFAGYWTLLALAIHGICARLAGPVPRAAG
jgi:hypothetical protein